MKTSNINCPIKEIVLIVNELDSLLSTEISNLEIPEQTYSILKECKINTIGDCIKAKKYGASYFSMSSFREADAILQLIDCYTIKLDNWPDDMSIEFGSLYHYVLEQEQYVLHKIRQKLSDPTISLDDISINESGFTLNVIRVLHFSHIFTLGDLVQQSESDMLMLPHLGRKTLIEFLSTLNSLGLSLRS